MWRGESQEQSQCHLQLLRTKLFKGYDKLCNCKWNTFSTAGFRLCSALENWLLTTLKFTMIKKLWSNFPTRYYWQCCATEPWLGGNICFITSLSHHYLAVIIIQESTPPTNLAAEGYSWFYKKEFWTEHLIHVGTKSQTAHFRFVFGCYRVRKCKSSKQIIQQTSTTGEVSRTFWTRDKNNIKQLYFSFFFETLTILQKLQQFLFYSSCPL